MPCLEESVGIALWDQVACLFSEEDAGWHEPYLGTVHWWLGDV